MKILWFLQFIFFNNLGSLQPLAVPVDFHVQLEIQKPWGSCLCKVRVYFSRLQRRDLSKINLIAFVPAN